jgi:hypothetical protein
VRLFPRADALGYRLFRRSAAEAVSTPNRSREKWSCDKGATQGGELPCTAEEMQSTERFFDSVRPRWPRAHYAQNDKLEVGCAEGKLLSERERGSSNQ